MASLSKLQTSGPEETNLLHDSGTLFGIDTSQLLCHVLINFWMSELATTFTQARLRVSISLYLQEMSKSSRKRRMAAMGG